MHHGADKSLPTGANSNTHHLVRMADPPLSFAFSNPMTAKYSTHEAWSIDWAWRVLFESINGSERGLVPIKQTIPAALLLLNP